MNKRILVTGCHGLLGGALVRALRGAGRPVLATGRRDTSPDPDWDYAGCDLADAHQVEALFTVDIGTVIHTAAQIAPVGTEPENSFLRNNVVATENILDAARARRGIRFINCSTISVYSGEGPYDEDASPTEPQSDYGRTKLAAENAVASRAGPDLAAVSLRLAGLHGGPRTGGVVCRFIRDALDGRPLQVAEPGSRFNLAFLDEVVAAIDVLICTDWPHDHAVYNLASRRAVDLRTLAETVLALTGSASTLEHGDGAPRNRVLNVDKINRDYRLPESDLEASLLSIIADMRTGGPADGAS